MFKIKFYFILLTAYDVDIIHLRADGNTEIVQQVSSLGVWNTLDLAIGSRIFACKKDDSSSFVPMHTHLESNRCYVDVDLFINQIIVP